MKGLRFRFQGLGSRVRSQGRILGRVRVPGNALGIQGVGCGVQGTGYRAQGAVRRAQGVGYRVVGFWVLGSGCWVLDLGLGFSGFKVQGVGCRV